MARQSWRTAQAKIAVLEASEAMAILMVKPKGLHDGSMTIKRRYARDTNFFLQFKGAEDLPWADLTDEAIDEVELIVLTEVARELDHYKGGGSGRRAKRARKILSQVIQPLLLGTAPGHEALIRAANPRVSYRLAPVLSPEH